MGLFSSIRTKLLLIFLTFGILPILLGGISLYIVLDNYLTNRAYEQLAALRNSKAKQLEFFFKDRIREIEFVAESNGLKLELSGKMSADNVKDIFPNKTFEKDVRYLSSTGYYTNYLITDGKNLVYSSFTEKPDFSFQKRLIGSEFESIWIRTSIWKKTVIQDFQPNSDLRNKIFIASPVIAEGKVIGMLAVTIDANKIDEILYDGRKHSSFGKTGDIFLVARDYLLRSNSLFFKQIQTGKKFHPKEVMNIFSETSRNFETTDFVGKDIFVSAERLDIPFLNWALLLTIRKAEALRSLKDVRFAFLIIILIFSLTIYAIAYYLSKKITSPIFDLERALRNIGRGEFAVHLKKKSHDEIGALTLAFNKMAKDLQELANTLRDREQRLFHFYSATSDGIILFKNDAPVLMNRAMERLTGIDREELLKKKVSEILSAPVENIRIEKDSESYETTLSKKNGAVFPVEIQKRKIKYNDELIDAVVIRDITQRKKIENELEETKRRHLTFIYDEIEKERSRLARELHDGLAQSLVALQMQLQKVSSCKDKENEKILDTVIHNLDGTIEEVRNISNDLIPAVLNEFGLSNALKKLCADLDSISDINISYEGSVLSKAHDVRTISYLYRIAQEALHNVIKHSHSQNASVRLSEEGEHVRMIIEDDGNGFNPSINRHGNGIRNMMERITILNGELRIDSQEGKGTKIEIVV